MHPVQREFSELTRRATILMLDATDVPRLLRTRLGNEDALAAAADEMLSSIEALVRELRSFDASPRDDEEGAAEDHWESQRR